MGGVKLMAAHRLLDGAAHALRLGCFLDTQVTGSPLCCACSPKLPFCEPLRPFSSAHAASGEALLSIDLKS